MYRVQLIHWDSAEAEQRADVLRRIGYEVSCEVPRDQGFLRGLAENRPDAVVIDLSRLPSQGRDLALGIRSRKATRMVALVFVGGRSDRIEGIRKLLPDAFFTSWGEIQGSLKKAVSSPPANPVRPRSVLEGYSGTPLTKKLDIREGYTVTLVDPPEGFRDLLGALPEDARLVSHGRALCDLMIWFVRSGKDLSARIRGYAGRSDYKSIWIAWPKKSSGMAADLSEKKVRETGLSAGLVDYKICAIDATWSGLLFTRRNRKGTR